MAFPIGISHLALEESRIAVPDLVELDCHLCIDADPDVVVHHLDLGVRERHGRGI